MPRSRRDGADMHASSISARPPAGRRTPTRPGRRWRRCSRPPPSLRRVSVRQAQQRRRDPDLRPRRAGDRGRQAAQGSSRRHRADQPPGRGSRRRASTEFPVVQGHDPLGQGPSRRVRAHASTITPRRRRPRAARSTFGPARDGAVSHCDIVLDLTGGAPLFPASDLRDGYLRADPARSGRGAAAVLQGARPRRHVSTSRATSPSPRICARIRARSIVGCNRCLDLCPTGAIAPAGDHVAIDAAYLRRLRPMRRRVPDRRGHLTRCRRPTR